MIYLNNEVYELSKDDSYIKLKEKCDKLGYPIKLRRSQNFITEVRKVGGNGNFKGMSKHYPSKFFDYTATERSAGGSKHWRYTLHPAIKDRDGVVSFEGDNGEFLNTFELNFEEFDLDKLWFLLEKSSIVNRRKIYSLYDPEAEYKERVDKESSELGVKFYIMAKESPLTIGQIRTIAKSFGMSRIDDMSDNKVKTALLDEVNLLERRGEDGYKRFMESTKLDRIVSVKADIVTAIDKNIIKWDDRSSTWYWLDAKGKPLSVIVKLKASDQPNRNDLLADFIAVSNELTERLQRELYGIPDSVLANETPERSRLISARDGKEDGYGYTELQKMCKQIPNYNPYGKKKHELVDRILDFHNFDK